MSKDVKQFRLPKTLYVGERIEMRDYVTENGFYPRVDMCGSPEDVMKFIHPPCDIYEIRPKLYRHKVEAINHPFATIFSYHDHIQPDAIVGRITYREQTVREEVEELKFKDKHEIKVLEMINQMKKIRLDLGISQEKLAKLTGSTQSTIAALENQATRPSILMFLRILGGLGYSLEMVEEEKKEEEIVEIGEFVMRCITCNDIHIRKTAYDVVCTKCRKHIKLGRMLDVKKQ